MPLPNQLLINLVHPSTCLIGHKVFVNLGNIVLAITRSCTRTVLNMASPFQFCYPSTYTLLHIPVCISQHGHSGPPNYQAHLDLSWYWEGHQNPVGIMLVLPISHVIWIHLQPMYLQVRIQDAGSVWSHVGSSKLAGLHSQEEPYGSVKVLNEIH